MLSGCCVCAFGCGYILFNSETYNLVILLNYYITTAAIYYNENMTYY